MRGRAAVVCASTLVLVGLAWAGPFLVVVGLVWWAWILFSSEEE